MKKIVTFLVGGSLVGSVLAAWFSPHLITWWFAPPVEVAISCRDAVTWGINTYRKAILAGSGVGIVGGGVFYLLSLRRKALAAQGQIPPANQYPK